MKTLLQLGILATLAMGSAFATDMHCHKTNEYTDVCEFSDGKVHVQTSVGDESWSEWYTAREWKAKQVKDASKERIRCGKWGCDSFGEPMESPNARRQARQDAATRRLCDKGDIDKAHCDD